MKIYVINQKKWLILLYKGGRILNGSEGIYARTTRNRWIRRVCKMIYGKGRSAIMRVCQSCKTKNVEESVFCRKCGAKLL